MNVSRRGFLGSILGTYVATQAPWIARLPNFVEPIDRKSPFRLLLMLDDGTDIKGPEILDVEHDVLNGMIKFIAQPIYARRTLTVLGSALVDAFGKPLIRDNFDRGAVTMFSGDRLNVTLPVKLTWIAENEALRPTSDDIAQPILEAARTIGRRNIIMPRI